MLSIEPKLLLKINNLRSEERLETLDSPTLEHRRKSGDEFCLKQVMELMTLVSMITLPVFIH